MDDLQGYKLSKKMLLQIAIKTINNTARPNGLVLIFWSLSLYIRIWFLYIYINLMHCKYQKYNEKSAKS